MRPSLYRGSSSIPPHLLPPDGTAAQGPDPPPFTARPAVPRVGGGPRPSLETARVGRHLLPWAGPRGQEKGACVSLRSWLFKEARGFVRSPFPSGRSRPSNLSASSDLVSLQPGALETSRARRLGTVRGSGGLAPGTPLGQFRPFCFGSPAGPLRPRAGAGDAGRRSALGTAEPGPSWSQAGVPGWEPCGARADLR